MTVAPSLFYADLFIDIEDEGDSSGGGGSGGGGGGNGSGHTDEDVINLLRIAIRELEACALN